MTNAELLAMCKNCQWKLNDVYSYRKLVLKNQKKYEEKILKILGESEAYIEDEVVEEDFFTEEIEIKAEPMVTADSPDIDDAHEEKFDVNEDVEEYKPEIDIKALRNRKTTPSRLYKKNRGNYQTAEKFQKDAEDFAIIAAHYDLSCDLCPESPKFSSYRDVTRHYTKAHHKTRKTFVCCGTKINNRKLMVQHAIMHRNPKVCETCGAQFVREQQFKKHFYECQPRFACDFCNQLFNKKAEILDHIQTKHIQHPKLLCEICGKAFSSVGSVNAHMKRKHFSEKSAPVFGECPECGKKLSSSSLKSHIWDVHKRTEPYVCNQCGKTFTTRKNFMRHVRSVHVVGRKYKCTIDGCDKALLTPESLREHIATHTGIPLYQCQYCEWSFKSAGNYYAHMRRKHPIEHAKMKQETKNKLYGITAEQQETGESEK